MGTRNVQGAARNASQASGLPSDVCAALIQLEGPSESAPNNPFDITQTWAMLSGVGGYVTGIFNDVGVAIFDDEGKAIQGWAYGLLNFSNYVRVRSLMADGSATVQNFFDALSATGYAGGDSGYGTNLGRVYQDMTGRDPTQVLLKGGTAPVSNPTTPSVPSVPTIRLPDLPNIQLPSSTTVIEVVRKYPVQSALAGLAVAYLISTL